MSLCIVVSCLTLQMQSSTSQDTKVGASTSAWLMKRWSLRRRTEDTSRENYRWSMQSFVTVRESLQLPIDSAQGGRKGDAYPRSNTMVCSRTTIRFNIFPSDVVFMTPYVHFACPPTNRKHLIGSILSRLLDFPRDLILSWGQCAICQLTGDTTEMIYDKRLQEIIL